MENNFDYELTNGGKIIEITIYESEHLPQDLIAKLEAEKESIILGKNEYLEKINLRIEYINSKLNAISKLINK